MNWETYKKYFNAWEGPTATWLEGRLRSPLFLEPAAAGLSLLMKVKSAVDERTASVVGALGLPTKRDQERTLHALNQIQGRLLDLEDRLSEISAAAEAREQGKSS
ncbi:MAG: hypothetical protein U0414_08300 [Polyangiaceae bacterium]